MQLFLKIQLKSAQVKRLFISFLLLFFQPLSSSCSQDIQVIDYIEGPHTFFWKEGNFINFGDHIALKIIEQIVGKPLRFYNKRTLNQEKKVLGLGSVFYFANEGDTIWGSGVNGKRPHKHDYQFSNLDIRAVRGPLTRKFLKDTFNIDCPEVYGDPGLLIPYLFPQFKKKETPSQDYVIIAHYLDAPYFHKMTDHPVVYATEAWDVVIEKILDSKFVISTSLHGVVVAESFGIPARILRISEKEPIIKFQDYYHGTNRPYFDFATSIEEALLMGGEPPVECDLKKLYEAFPFDLWPNHTFTKFHIP